MPPNCATPRSTSSSIPNATIEKLVEHGARARTSRPAASSSTTALDHRGLPHRPRRLPRPRRWETEDTGRGTWHIVVTEIPYQVQKSRLIEKIAELLLARRLPLLDDVRDESAEDIRLVLEPKSRTVDPDTADGIAVQADRAGKPHFRST